MLERGHALQRKIWGDSHEQLASSWAALGELDLASGRFARARERFAQALALWTKTLGEKHPDRAGGLAGLGASLVGLGRVDAGRPLLEEALKIGPVPRGQRADAEAALARALCATRSTRARARDLAESASATYATLGGIDPERGRALDAWMRGHCRP